MGTLISPSWISQRAAGLSCWALPTIEIGEPSGGHGALSLVSQENQVPLLSPGLVWPELLLFP